MPCCGMHTSNSVSRSLKTNEIVGRDRRVYWLMVWFLFKWNQMNFYFILFNSNSIHFEKSNRFSFIFFSSAFKD